MFAHVLQDVRFDIAVHLAQKRNQIRQRLLCLFVLDTEGLFENVERVFRIFLCQVVALLHVNDRGELLACPGYDWILFTKDISFDFERLLIAGRGSIQVLDIHINPGIHHFRLDVRYLPV